MMLKIISGIIGAIIIAYVIYNFYDLYGQIKEHKKLNVFINQLSVILSLFLIGFIYFISKYVNNPNISKNVIISLFVYITSAFFVLLIIKHSSKMIQTLKEKQEEYIQLNKSLEDEAIAERNQLEHKIEDLEKTRTAMINILEDISEQKDTLETTKKDIEKLNRKLKKSNTELLSLDNQKNQFTSITAHELKTPLASIHGFVQLLLNKKVFNDEQQRDKYMKIILHDTERLSKLITDVLDISRIDLGTLKFYYENVEINKLFDNIEKEMRPIANSKNINISYNISRKLPNELITDKSRLSQVLTNLINNAVHYTPEKGKIWVSAEESNNHVLFKVKDNGVGIPKDQIDKIFQRFYQVDNWLTRKIGGSGLGLAICKGIITALGGNIDVSSAVNKGSAFSFTIPLKSQEIHGDEKYVKVFGKK